MINRIYKPLARILYTDLDLKNIDAGGTQEPAPTPPTPITYLTQWKIVGNSEVHTLPYPDGIVLPTGYKRCEYLTFDGSSYINTGVKTANDIGYNLTCSSNGNVQILIGARTSVSSNGFGLGFGYVAYGGASVSKGISYSSSKVNVLLDATQCKVGNNNYDISDIRATATTFFDIYVGTWNQNGSPDSRMWQGNIYDTIIYNVQGELWHGIPCLDTNNVPCFYDVISQTAFYNQGTGTFGYELYPQPTEIWSCGEYNATDGKWHILVQPLGGSIADIALSEPLRKVADVADTIEFPSSTEGKALVTRNLVCVKNLGGYGWYASKNTNGAENYIYRMLANELSIAPKIVGSASAVALCAIYSTNSADRVVNRGDYGIALTSSFVTIRDANYGQQDSASALKQHLQGIEFIYWIEPTTELVDAPQIEKADNYTCVISPDAKAVEWSSFTPNYLLALAVDTTAEIEVKKADFAKVIVDADDKILYGLKTDGTEYTPDLTGDTITIGSITYDAQFIVDIVKTTL